MMPHSLWQPPLNRMYCRLLEPTDAPGVDFTAPIGEEALFPADSVSWQVCKNPLTLMCGGISAVILQLAEPRVGSGVWRHTGFRAAPVARARRTGLATLATVYAARSQAECFISAVRQRHAAVRGRTADGEEYDARDPELLDWVYATASVGFLDAWDRLVRPLSQQQRDAYLAEGGLAGGLYGAAWRPTSQRDWYALLDHTLGRLRPSPIIQEFLDILAVAPLLPKPLQSLQRLVLRAAVELVPLSVRRRIALDAEPLGRLEYGVLVAAARVVDSLVIPASPPVRACRRLGLSERFLY
jgi:uncharacterized protein (DUF2236 family)